MRSAPGGRSVATSLSPSARSRNGCGHRAGPHTHAALCSRVHQSRQSRDDPEAHSFPADVGYDGVCRRSLPFSIPSPGQEIRTVRYRAVYVPCRHPVPEQPEFSDPECRDWSVIKAWNFESIDSHVAFRTERFDTGRALPFQEKVLNARLRLQTPRILHEARQRGYAEVHILHEPDATVPQRSSRQRSSTLDAVVCKAKASNSSSLFQSTTRVSARTLE